MATPPSPSEELYGIPLPRNFNGDKREFTSFMNELAAFLSIDSEHPNTDDYKIALTLSLMNEDIAARWSLLFKEEKLRIQDLNPGSALSYGTWADFRALLDTDFAPDPFDIAREAMGVLDTMEQGRKTAAEHIRDFKAVYARTGMNSDPDGIYYFRKTLNVGLLKKVLDRPNGPKTLDEWYEISERLDTNYRKMLRIIATHAK